YAIPFFDYLDKKAKAEASKLCKRSSRTLYIYAGKYNSAFTATQGAGNWQVATLPFDGPLQFYEYLEVKRMSSKFTIPFDDVMNQLYRID
ncbi:hypothetical protein GGF42_001421, partial [Coemansia sp. RSA 2424]